MRYNQFEELPLTISVAQLADILQIGRNSAYELARSGQIRSIRIGHQIRISKAALMKFLSEDKKVLLK